VNLFAVATWDDTQPNESGHFTFAMRPELARALRKLGWVRGAQAPEEGVYPETFVEGLMHEQFIAHYSRERRLRDAKIFDSLKRSSDGRLRCEVSGCGFDFEAQYGSLGRGYAEVHHLKPLAGGKGPRETRLEDLALVCANCHAMIHRYGENRRLSALVRGRGR
jgi:predicted HNH restriction endonuclease